MRWPRGLGWQTFLSLVAFVVVTVLAFGYVQQQQRLDQREKTLAEVSATAERSTRLLEVAQNVSAQRFEEASAQRAQLQVSIDLLNAFLRSQGVEVPIIKGTPTPAPTTPSSTPTPAAPAPRSPQAKPQPKPTSQPKPTKAPQPTAQPSPAPQPSQAPEPAPAPAPTQGGVLGICVIGICL